MSVFVAEGVGRKAKKQVRGKPLDLRGTGPTLAPAWLSSIGEIGWGTPGLQTLLTALSSACRFWALDCLAVSGPALGGAGYPPRNLYSLRDGRLIEP